MESLEEISDPDPYLVEVLKIAYTNTSFEGQKRSLRAWYEEVERNYPAYRQVLTEETGWAIEALNEMSQPSGEELGGKLALRENLPPVFMAMVVRTALSGYKNLDQLDRDGMDHFWLYGNAGKHALPFCKLLEGRVFTKSQVEKMENGLVEPVSLFVGGWCCRHSWQAVDPEWDDDLKSKIVEEDQPRTIALDPQEKMTMQVFCSKEDAKQMQETLAEEWQDLRR